MSRDSTSAGSGEPGTGGAILVPDVRRLRLGPAQPPIYDRPIGLRLLHEDPASGAEHYLVSYPAGLEARQHRHSVAHTIVVIEGKLTANGETIDPGGYCHFPAGEPMHHAPVEGESCLFVTIFHGPFDVQLVDD